MSELVRSETGRTRAESDTTSSNCSNYKQKTACTLSEILLRTRFGTNNAIQNSGPSWRRHEDVQNIRDAHPVFFEIDQKEEHRWSRLCLAVESLKNADGVETTSSKLAEHRNRCVLQPYYIVDEPNRFDAPMPLLNFAACSYLRALLSTSIFRNFSDKFCTFA